MRFATHHPIQKFRVDINKTHHPTQKFRVAFFGLDWGGLDWVVGFIGLMNTPIRDHVQDKRSVKRSFKFENMWTRDDSCSQVVEESWKQSRIGNFKDLADTVASCGVNLTKWNKVHYCNLQNLIKKK